MDVEQASQRSEAIKGSALWNLADRWDREVSPGPNRWIVDVQVSIRDTCSQKGLRVGDSKKIKIFSKISPVIYVYIPYNQVIMCISRIIR